MKTKENKAVEMPFKGIIEDKRTNDSLTEINALEVNTEALTAIDETETRNRIESAIEDYKIEYNTDITSLKQLQWNSVLEYIYNNAIKPMRIDYRQIQSLITLCDIYLSICRMYNKTSSVYGYCIYSNIPYSSITAYKYNIKAIKDIYIDTTKNCIVDNNLIDIYKAYNQNSNIIKVSNSIFSVLCKKIEQDRQHALTDRTEDGSVMSLALGKIEYSWIESAKEKIQVEMLENYRLPSDLIDKYSDNS